MRLHELRQKLIDDLFIEERIHIGDGWQAWLEHHSSLTLYNEAGSFKISYNDHNEIFTGAQFDSEDEACKAYYDLLSGNPYYRYFSSDLPIAEAELSELFSHLENPQNLHCDHTYKRTIKFMLDHNLPTTELLKWLRENQGYCDCSIPGVLQPNWLNFQKIKKRNSPCA